MSGRQKNLGRVHAHNPRPFAQFILSGAEGLSETCYLFCSANLINW